MPDVTGLTDMRQVVETYRSAFTDRTRQSKTSLRRGTKSHAVGRTAPLTKAK
jgi:hypothetical protein